MRETPHITHIPSADSLPDLGGAPEIRTPVIDTRIGNGLKSKPLRSDDEDAIQALEQIERSLRGQLPG